MNPPAGRDEQVAELQRKLDNFLRLQEHVTQQQEEIESKHLLTKEALATAKQELESTQKQLDDALAQLRNAGPTLPSEIQALLAQKDDIIAQQHQKILDLEQENEALKNKNKKKSSSIKLYQEIIVQLQAQIETHEHDFRVGKAIYNSEVLKALIKKNCRLSCVENLRRLLKQEDCSDEIVKYFRSLRDQGKDASEAANRFLAKYPRLNEFTPDGNKVLGEIRARVSKTSMTAIKAVLDEVGDIKDEAGVQDDFFGIRKNGKPGWATRAAEDFLEQHPNYLVPLTVRANEVLVEVKGRVTLLNYNRLKSDITSDQRGMVINNRVLFFRLVAEGRGASTTAKKFIRESGTNFDGFFAKYL